MSNIELTRRTFMFGALCAVGMPAGATIPIAEAKGDPDLAAPALMKTPWICEVEPEGRISISGYVPPTLRKELYWLNSRSVEDARSIEYATMDVEPLRWEVDNFYQDWRDRNPDLADDWSEDIEQDLDTFLEALPEPELQRLQQQLLAWMDSEPSNSEEWDYFREPADGADLAFKIFFECEDFDMLDTLGIAVVEGDRPGSSYRAAELTMDIDTANQAAENAGIPYRFVRVPGYGAGID